MLIPYFPTITKATNNSKPNTNNIEREKRRERETRELTWKKINQQEEAAVEEEAATNTKQKPEDKTKE